jgi:hypothetical protein
MKTPKPKVKVKVKVKMNTMRFKTETHLVGHFVGNFSGRKGEVGYDIVNKTFRLHRRNRAYVWGRDRQLAFLDTMLLGLPCPPIYCNEYFDENGVRRRDIMEGGNRSTTMSRIMRGLVRDLTPAEIMLVQTYEIQVVLMTNLNSAEQRIMFRRLNNSVKVSDGHLYAMSEEDSPLVQHAVALLNDLAYPLRARITGAFFDTVDADNAGRCNLANAMAIVSGAANGVQFITKSFARNEHKVEDQAPINTERIIYILDYAIQVFERADEEFPLDNRRRRKEQWSIGWALGAIMYDLTMNPNPEQSVAKWVRWIVAVRRGDDTAKEAIDIKGAQNINPDKLKRKSYKVQKFLDTGELATEDELKSIKHGSHEEDDMDEDDVYSDTNE